ncbi:hypothetical protein BH23CHL2_BH23CHL2_01430 [soil metagenome]
MILLIMIAIGFLIGIFSGGSLSGFGEARFRYIPLLLAGGLVQVIIFTEYVGTEPIVRELAPYLYVGALAAGLVAIYLNRHIFGMKVVFAGALLNFIVIAINGGSMPAREESLRIAGTLEHVQNQHARIEAGEDVQWPQLTFADDDTRLAFLGDVLPIPSAFPAANVVSIGDVLISAGAIVAIVWVMHLRPVEKKPDPDSIKTRQRDSAPTNS